jgi:hypothetical protein
VQVVRGRSIVPVIDAVLVVAMVCLSGWGGVRLPPDARVPVHFGRWSRSTAVPKTPGLVVWAAVGVVTWLGGVLGAARTGGPTARAALTLALATILVTQGVAVALAVTRSRRS